MSHVDSASQDAYFSALLDTQKVSRCLPLRQITGLVFVSSSLIPFATACSSAPNATPATQAAISSAQGTTIITYHAHSGALEALQWSPDGKHIASGSLDRIVQVWEAATGKRTLMYRGHTGVVAGVVTAVVWSPDGEFPLRLSLPMTVLHGWS